ncbi:unnamed protein product [Camellia sinensis]
MESNKIVISKNDIFIGKGFVCDGLFKLNVSFEVNYISHNIFNIEVCDLWHKRLGHVNLGKIRKMMDLELVPKSSIDVKRKCEICVKAKQPKKPYKSVQRNSQVLDLIYSDVCDSNRLLTRARNKYFVTFIDDCSKFCYLYLIKTKDDVFSKFKIYKAEVENQLERKIKKLRSDRGGEYNVGTLSTFCEEHGIIHEVTPPYSPQSNGIAERKNRTLMDMINAILISSGLPKSLWGEAILTACVILNRVIVNDNDKTPYKIWRKRVPNLKMLRVWGCLAKVAIPEPKRKKIGPKTVDTVFLGYAQNSSANRFLVINFEISEITNNTIIESHEATFFEDIFPYKTRISNQVVNRTSTPSTSVIPLRDDCEHLNIEPRRSKRTRIQKTFGDDFYTFLIEGEPNTFIEAISFLDAPLWKEAINSEFESILQNNTWE